MRSLLISLCLVFAMPTAARAAQPLIPIDRIVAVVNKGVITQSELNRQVALARRELERQGTPLPARKALDRQILDRLILERLQLQLAAQLGIKVPRAQVDEAVARIAARNHLTQAEFREALQRDNVDYDRFRKDVHKQIVLAELRQREVNDKIHVTNSEVEHYLQQHRSSDEMVEYDLAHILIRLPDQASPHEIAQARARAEKARMDALTGGDFAKIAATYSDASDSLRGGVIGWRAADRLPGLFVEALDHMKPGGISPVLRSPAGFHIIKLLGRRTVAGGPPVMQTHVRQILIRTNEVVSNSDARHRLLNLRQRILMGHESFAKLARLYSQDPSAANGGDLGWVYPGDTVPQFQRAMNALKPGEVSEPVHTRFGWSLIEVLARREAPPSVDRLKLQAREALRERKAGEAYQQWLRQLRDSAYVQIRLHGQ